MIRALIIDDDIRCQKSLRENIKLYCENIQIIDSANTVASGLEAIHKYKPELVFLDIEMPDGTGFDLLGKLEEINFKVIFQTAHQEYAIKAFKFSAIDYLLKPINYVELIGAVERVSQVIESESIDVKLKTFFSHFNNEPIENKNIILKTQDQIHYVKINSIIRCQSDNNYTAIYLEDGRQVVVSKTLKEYEEMLTEYAFFRVHQSHLVNLKHILSFNKVKNRKKSLRNDLIEGCESYILLQDGSKIPVSQRKRDKLLTILEAYNKVF